MVTGEEARLTGKANQLIENSLSSVKIIHDKKGTTSWEIKVKDESPLKAMRVSLIIDKELREEYGTK